MKLRCTQAASRKPPAITLESLPWVGLLALAAGGCVSGRPWPMRIEGGPAAVNWENNGADAASLSVTTFNVWGLPAWINGASPSRQARIARALEELGSDVVLLQEVWTHQSYEVLAQHGKGDSRTWWTAAARRKGSFLGQNGLLTLSRYPIESAGLRPFTAASLPDSLMRKGALRVTLAIRPGQRVNVWNVHLQDGGPPRVRAHQIGELVRWIEEADDGQIADIVGGDFNFTPDSEEFRRFVSAVGFSVHQLAKSAPLPTWDGLRPAPGGGETLDHIFVKPRRAEEKITAQPRRLFWAARREERLSDHMGVEALLTIRWLGAKSLPALVWRKPAFAFPETTAVGRR